MLVSAALVENADCTVDMKKSDNDSTDWDSGDSSDKHFTDEQLAVQEYLNGKKNEEEKKNKYNTGSLMRR